MPESKAHQIFRSRIEYINQHLEAVDAGLTALDNAASAAIDQTMSIAQMMKKEDKYPSLNKPVSRSNAIVSFSRATNVEHAIIFLFRSFDEYLRNIIRYVFECNPYKVIGLAATGKSVTFPELVKLGNFDAISNKIVRDVYRDLENERSTLKLIKKITNRLGLEMPTEIRDRALSYLEMRHLIVHNDSKVDAAFASKYGAEFQVSEGSKLPRKFSTVTSAKIEIKKLAEVIDQEINRLFTSGHETLS